MTNMKNFKIQSKTVRGQAIYTDDETGVQINVDWRESLEGGVMNISGSVQESGVYKGDFSGRRSESGMIYSFNGLSLDRLASTAQALSEIEQHIAAASVPTEAANEESAAEEGGEV